MSTIKFRVQYSAIVILAAGKSSLLGTPKQLLIYKDKGLLQHAVDMALQTNIQPVLIVLGANNSAIL